MEKQFEKESPACALLALLYRSPFRDTNLSPETIDITTFSSKKLTAHFFNFLVLNS